MKPSWKSPQFGRARVGVAMAVLLFAPYALPAQANLLKKKGPKQTQVQNSLDDYLKRVHAMDIEPPRTTGSLWFPAAPLAMTASDYKARQAGDLIIIRVVDNFSASTNGSGQSQRAFTASSGVSSFLGNIPATSRWQNLFSPTSSETLNGKGQSALTSNLSLNLAGRVVEALSNGVLVVEAARDLAVGSDRQTIVIRGLVRPGDIASDGSVLSSSIANLEAQIRGKGLVADAMQQPNVVIRTLMKILSF